MKKKLTGPPCMSTASGGVMKCALRGEHAVHSSSDGHRSQQYATWTVVDDGRVQVTTYSAGKKVTAEWFEDRPAGTKSCGSPLSRGADGSHIAKNHQIGCSRDPGHDGPHRGFSLSGKHVSQWTGDGSSGSVHVPKHDVDGLAALENPAMKPAPRPMTLEDEPDDQEADAAAIAAGALDPDDEPDEIEMRNLARQHREAREAHAVEIEAPPKSSLADPCAKCGRELGEHDGKKCPKPEKRCLVHNAAHAQCTLKMRHAGRHTDGANEFDSAGTLNTDPAGHKQLSKPHSAAWNCDCAPGLLQRHMMGDEGCGFMPNGSVRQVAASGPVLRIGLHDIHPAAAVFPMIGVAEYPSFLDDLRANGQRKPIVRIKVGSSWSILDGRNRLRACLDLKIDPKFRAFGDDAGDGADPIAFVVSENIHRRHLDETARAFVGAELVPMYEAQAKDRQSTGGKAKGQANLPEAQRGQARDHAARAVNVSPRSVEAALRVNRDAIPEVIAAAKDRGQLKVSAAAELSTLSKKRQREIVEKVGGGEIRAGKVRALVKQEKKRDVVRAINEQRVEAAPLGPFRVIAVDPPWPYDNSDQHDGSRGHIPYPSMSLDEICAMRPEFDRLAHGDGCILGLWITNAFIHELGRVLSAWGFTHRTMITWAKDRPGMGSWPRGQTEHLVIASRGEPTHTLNEVTTLFHASLREHSRKPDEMMDIFVDHCAGPRLEMFAREPREQWQSWGAEPKKFAGAA